jgi:protein Tex
MTISEKRMAAPLAAKDLKLPLDQVNAVEMLLNEGNTIPFIARYRKEVHGNLDELQIQLIQEKLVYYTALEERRLTILTAIAEQGKLSDELKARIESATLKAELEDLYLPYKPKRRTRATIAREKGLEPLALLILSQPATGTPLTEAARFINPEKELPSAEEALAGARDIVAEFISEKSEIRANMRKAYFRSGIISSEKAKADLTENSKFKDYFDFSQPISRIPSHRYLAIRRGEEEGELKRKLSIEAEPQIECILECFNLNTESPFANELKQAAEDSYKRLLIPSIESEVSADMKSKADRTAVNIFAQNLRALLLAPPFGEKRVIGIDPGLRTGCKCAAVDATGKYLDTITIYPSQGAEKEQAAKSDLASFIEKHQPQAIAIGNGTAGRETEAFTNNLLKELKRAELPVIAVSEAGASVYSASEIAREEFPDLDLTIRGAISIARRLQDPLAELVKVDPKSIGVGQYQHDVQQTLLQEKLDEVVISCVNRIGADLNTASASLLTRVAGIGPGLAKKIVAHRNEKGAFKNRKQLLEIAGLGPKAYEQAAGFLRINGGDQPLDASSVHPERYPFVEKLAQDLETPLATLIGNDELIDKIKLEDYISAEIGELTLRDILKELRKPGRDPRKAFQSVEFRKDVMKISDLKEGMELKGIVTNVTAFGAFVDIGVHQDGLVHISQLTNTFVKDPNEVVKTGDLLDVRVLEVDPKRKRISLTARKEGDAPVKEKPAKEQPTKEKPAKEFQARRPKPKQAANTAKKRWTPDAKPEKQSNQRPVSGFKNNPFADL